MRILCFELTSVGNVLYAEPAMVKELRCLTALCVMISCR